MTHLVRREENTVSQATIKPTPPAPVTLAEFDEIFEAVKNWGRWGPDDELGTLNYITADTVRAAAATVRSGRRATMAIAMNTAAGPDNPSPVTHHVVQGHDIDIGSSGVTFATDYVGLAFHGDCHTPDTLNWCLRSFDSGPLFVILVRSLPLVKKSK